ncbi:MAG: 23S rRNA (uracil(1939)-C(5))-methyltransferase RlmD [Bacillota bacterium]
MAERKPPVQRNDDIALTIDALGAEGQGIGRVDGYAVFVPGALPGERVRAHIIKAGSGFGVGKLMKIEAPAPERVDPPCAIFAACGGCALQHMEYGAQLAYKRKVVEDALVRIGGLKDIRVSPVLGMDDPWRYRNKGSFPLANAGPRVETGFFSPRSHRLVPMPDCLIQQQNVLQAAYAVRDWANQYDIPAYDEQTGNGLLRHVVARASCSGEAMATVVATGTLPHKKELLEFLQKQVDGLASVYLNIQRAKSNVILGDDYRLLWGKEKIEEQLCGLVFSLGPASFLQVNPSQTERLYATALDLFALTGGERVVDAYCGIGTITLLLARSAREVIGIENVPEAVEDARRNAQRNGMRNAQFLCEESEAALPRLIREGMALDALVMDPPRKGADEAFLRAVIESGVKRVLYISCNPATLARDCRILADGWYHVRTVQPVDMFPHTVHVETVVLMSRVKD